VATVHEIVYDEAMRGLDLQRASVDALRSRAGTLLAAAALVTTFLGGQALEGDRALTCLGWWAVAAFIGVAALAIVVLLPWRFDFSLSAPELVADYIDVEPRPTPEEVLRNLALFADEARADNKRTIGVLQWSFRVAAVLLGGGCPVVRRTS
jgi:hypothetical protein